MPSEKKLQSAVLVGKFNPESVENLVGNRKAYRRHGHPPLPPQQVAGVTCDDNRKEGRNRKLSTGKMEEEGLKEKKKEAKEGQRKGDGGDGGGRREETKKKRNRAPYKQLMDLQVVGGDSVLISRSSTSVRYPQNDHRLDKLMEEVLRKHGHKDTGAPTLKEAITRCDLRTEQYRDALSSNSMTELKEMLAECIRENFELKQEVLEKDAKFLQLQLDQVNGSLRKKRPKALVGGTASKSEIFQILEEASEVEKDLKVRLAKTEIALIEKSNLLREVGGRMAMLEEKCELLEHENQFLRKTHENCVKSLKSKNEVLEKRCERTDTRRKLEGQGLSEDIRECKFLLKTLSRNVAKCAKLYQQAKIDIQTRGGGRKGKDLELTLVEESGGNQKPPDRLTNWMLGTNPKVAHKAMSVWTQYLQGRVSTLEGQVTAALRKEDDEGNSDLEVIYDTPSERSRSRSRKHERQRTVPQEEERGRKPILKKKRDVASDMSTSTDYRDYYEVPPSPTWIQIQQMAGLKDRVKPMPEWGARIATSDEE